MEKQIFTFWEPAGTVFPYLNLCMETWKKYYPDYDIHLVSYSNLFDFIDSDLYDFDTLKQYSLPIQADAIRVALLYRHGGMWLDCDTVIANNTFFNIFDENVECGMVGIAQRKLPHIGIIKASKGAKLLECWLGEIQRRLSAGSEGVKNANWAHLGNAILNLYINNIDASLFECVDKEKYYIIPEENFMKENGYTLPSLNNYRYFWFENDFSDFLSTKNILGVCLHNSWTPPFIKKLSQDDFLRTECTLASLVGNILEISPQKKIFYWDYMKNDFLDQRKVDADAIYNINIDGLNYDMYLPDECDIDQSLVIKGKKPREINVIREMRKYILNSDNAVLVDIGHNCGNHSAYFAALGVEVHAFDPNRHLAKILEKTIEINNFSNVHLYNVGLGEHEFSTSFQKINPNHSGSMALNGEQGSLCDIKVISLDSLRLSFPYKKVIVKIDVEGMELSVLRGMAETLKELRPEALFIEIHTLQQLKDILDFLSPYSYTLDCMMESHTCKFIPRRCDEVDLFISEQRFLMKEFFDILGRFGTTINNQKYELFWNCILFNPECVLPDDVYFSQDTGKHYLQAFIRGVSPRIHYEFLKTPQKLQCCLHCEDAALAPVYKDFFEKMAQTLGSKCLVGKTLQINIDTTTGSCISVLKKMIALSLDEIKSIHGKI